MRKVIFRNLTQYIKKKQIFYIYYWLIFIFDNNKFDEKTKGI